MNMKGQIYFKRDVYDSQRIDRNNMGHVHSKIMFMKTNVPILGIMILFMEAHKCVPVVM
jgi:hypothetical protein